MARLWVFVMIACALAGCGVKGQLAPPPEPDSATIDPVTG